MNKTSLLLALTLALNVNSQNLDYGNSSNAISICNAIQGRSFASERVANSVLDDILNVIGASKRFVLQECSNINNAVALTVNGVRYIMYDPDFMTSLSSGSNWGKKFILAHEVGHHINGHTVDVLAANSSNRISLESSRIQELEADEFAGFVLGRLGATLSQALSGVQSLSDEDDTYSTHPRRSKRIAAIKKGFAESGGYVNPSEVSVKNGKTVDSPYSNTRFAGVEHVTMNYDNGIYSGYIGLESKTPFGYGEFKNSDGYIYEGEWSNGKYNGYGKQSWSDGSAYEGYFVDWKRTGQGVYTSPSSDEKYVGVFANGRLVNGTKFFDDKKEEGIWDEVTGNPIRVTVTEIDQEPWTSGFLDNSNGEGYATYTYADGTTVKGIFKNGGISVQRGLLGGEFGTQSLHNYIGKSRSDKKAIILPTYVFDFIPKQIRMEYGIDDPETFYISAYSSRSSLEFLEKHKNEKLYTKDLSLSIKFYGRGTLDPNSSQTGQYLNDKYGAFTYVGETLGFGEINWPGGTIYKGYFLSGSIKKYGYGEIYYDKDDPAESYKGMWWFDRKNGYGVMTYKDGTIEKGVFKNNEFVKEEDFDFNVMQQTFKTWY